jgi:putative membrane protein (TIGR04086 family)
MKSITMLRWSSGEKASNRVITPGSILSGLAWAVSTTLAICILMYAWVILSVSPVFYMGTLVIAGVTLGALIGGIAAGKASEKLGLIHGFLAGLCYGLLLLALFSWGGSSFALTEIIARMLWLGMAGALGGIIGINLPRYNGQKTKSENKK